MGLNERYVENQEIWIKHHNQKRYRPKYPSEPVIQYVLHNFQCEKKPRILDAGCGAGRHVIFMADVGVEPYGLDFSTSGVEYTKSMLMEKGYEEYALNVLEGGVDNIPFDDDFFDGLISYGVLYYLSYQKIVESVKEFYRILKPGGKCFVTVRSLEDYRYLSGEKTEEHHTVYVTESSAERGASSERGMAMHFFFREEFADLFSMFENVTIDDYILSHENGAYRDCNFFLTGEKKK
ncbi:MAG: class I SAM-dependent methyltransferase [Bacteroides sp.]|nr:class I SAM-dependent methyltransferase [Bacteroides sp.]MCM1549028.1 class I SAM-dependent methyltransferase [Clostridium sp.]